MKRKEVESSLQDLQSQVVGRINAAPMAAFIVGLALGAVLMRYHEVLLPLVVIAALVLGGMWIFADKDDGTSSKSSGESSASAGSSPKTNGASEQQSANP